jgi:hypothetical protein
LRADHAKAIRYDPTFRFSEDSDYLLRFLRGKHYGVLPAPFYAYTEYESVTEEKILQSLAYKQRSLRKHRDAFPVASRAQSVAVGAKTLAYRVAFSLGLREKLLARRSRRPTEEERVAFEKARGMVMQRLGQNPSSSGLSRVTLK